MARKYVLTGGPGTGKSTVLGLLQQKGFYTLGDVATYLIRVAMVKGLPRPEAERDGFQRKVLETQLCWEREIPAERDMVFIDKGVIDGLAYYHADGLNPTDELVRAARNSDYAAVFLLEPLCKPDGRSQILHEAVERAYREHGHNPVRIPAGSPEERVRIILELAGAREAA